MVQTAQIGRKLARKRVRRAYEGGEVKPPLTGAQVVALLEADGVIGAWADRQDMSERFETRPFYETATPEEWLAAFTEWTQSHRDLPRVPPSAFSREADYEDRL